MDGEANRGTVAGHPFATGVVAWSDTAAASRGRPLRACGLLSVAVHYSAASDVPTVRMGVGWCSRQDEPRGGVDERLGVGGEVWMGWFGAAGEFDGAWQGA